MTIIVTGAAGFVGANNVKALNDLGERDIIAVDNLARSEKFRNLVDCEIADYLDKDAFREHVRRGALPKPDVVFHQGACSDTMETDGRYMLDNNFRYSLELLRWCQDAGIPFIFASSGSVYGLGPVFAEERLNEKPLNVYGYSKFLFDQIVRRMLPAPKAPVIGLRYFNVYGPRETHKGRMASVGFHHFHHANVGANEAISGFFGLPVADWLFGTYHQPKELLLQGRMATAKDFAVKPPPAWVRALDEWARKRESALARKSLKS